MVYTYRKDIFLIGLAFLLLSCSMKVQQRSSSFKILSQKEIHKDAECARTMLQKAYVGYKFQDIEIMNRALTGLSSLSVLKNISPEEFCERMSSVIAQIPDAHLALNLPGQGNCGNSITNTKKLFNNLHIDSGSEWGHYKKSTPNGKEVDVIAIPSFATGGDIESNQWKNFIRTSDFLKEKPYFIIDLRSNGGGTSMVIFDWLQNFMSKDSEITMKYTILQSPEALKNVINYLTIKINRAKTEEERRFHAKIIEDLEKTLTLAEKSEIPEWEEKVISASGIGKKAYSGTIYILMDEGTASAAEFAIGWIDSKLTVIKIGKNTAGHVHFAYMGTAILPNSKINFRLGTHYYPIKYGFIEKMGITPDIKINQDEDALQKAFIAIDERFE